MDTLTTKLEQKVDLMLKQQQNQFISSYMGHMKKVKQEFTQADKKMQQYEKKIRYYENEGEMSHLVIKVNKLQEQCRKLYKSLSERDKLVRDNQLTIKVQKSEMKRYEKELKLLIREKNQLLIKIGDVQIENNNIFIKNSNLLSDQKHISPKKNLTYQHSPDRSFQKQHDNSHTQTLNNALKQLQSLSSTNNIVFPTELLQNNHTNLHKNDLSTQQYLKSHQSRQQFLNYKSSQQSLTLTKDFSLQKEQSSHYDQQYQNSLLSKVRQMQLKREVNSLKKKNQLLNSFQSYVLDAKTDMESFFVHCVEQIKQQIRMRKKINQCTFDEFKKEDKIQLLVKIISNDDILGYLYERIFKKKKIFGNNQEDDLNDNLGKSIGSKKEIKNNARRSLQRLIDEQKIIDQNSLGKGPIPYSQTLRCDIQKGVKIKVNLSEQTMNSQMGLPNKKKKSISEVAKRRFSKNISENSILPKIHFHLEY